MLKKLYGKSGNSSEKEWGTAKCLSNSIKDLKKSDSLELSFLANGRADLRLVGQNVSSSELFKSMIIEALGTGGLVYSEGEEGKQSLSVIKYTFITVSQELTQIESNRKYSNAFSSLFAVAPEGFFPRILPRIMIIDEIPKSRLENVKKESDQNEVELTIKSLYRAISSETTKAVKLFLQEFKSDEDALTALSEIALRLCTRTFEEGSWSKELIDSFLKFRSFHEKLRSSQSVQDAVNKIAGVKIFTFRKQDAAGEEFKPGTTGTPLYLTYAQVDQVRSKYSENVDFFGGHEFSVKGLDSLPNLASATDYEYLMTSLKRANLRVINSENDDAGFDLFGTLSGADSSHPVKIAPTERNSNKILFEIRINKFNQIKNRNEISTRNGEVKMKTPWYEIGRTASSLIFKMFSGDRNINQLSGRNKAQLIKPLRRLKKTERAQFILKALTKYEPSSLFLTKHAPADLREMDDDGLHELIIGLYVVSVSGQTQNEESDDSEIAS